MKRYSGSCKGYRAAVLIDSISRSQFLNGEGRELALGNTSLEVRSYVRAHDKNVDEAAIGREKPSAVYWRLAIKKRWAVPAPACRAELLEFSRIRQHRAGCCPDCGMPSPLWGWPRPSGGCLGGPSTGISRAPLELLCGITKCGIPSRRYL